MKLASIKFAALSGVAALALAGAGLAQPAPPPGAGPHAEGRQWQRPDPAQMAERHAQHLRDALQLRPDQEPALRALLAAVQPPAGEHEHMGKDRDDDRGLTTPQRLDRQAARMAEHAARFRTRAEAMTRFYVQLSPTQQKAFDAMPLMGEHGHGKHGHEKPGREGPDGGRDHGPLPPPGA